MTLEKLRWLRDEFSDEIPDKVLHGKGNFKVRRNWWTGLVAHLESGVENGAIPDGLRDEIDIFVEHYTSDEFHDQALTTERDVQQANGLLDKILGKK